MGGCCERRTQAATAVGSKMPLTLAVPSASNARRLSPRDMTSIICSPAAPRDRRSPRTGSVGGVKAADVVVPAARPVAAACLEGLHLIGAEVARVGVVEQRQVGVLGDFGEA